MARQACEMRRVEKNDGKEGKRQKAHMMLDCCMHVDDKCPIGATKVFDHSLNNLIGPGVVFYHGFSQAEEFLHRIKYILLYIKVYRSKIRFRLSKPSCQGVSIKNSTPPVETFLSLC